MSRKSVSTICIIVLCLACNFALADSHRMETTPTDWWWYHSQSNADIVNVIEETGSRLIDIEIQSTEPLRFAAAFVHNSGVYAETWLWFFDKTPGDIETLLNRNEARLIDIERYETENGPRYAVIMVDNSGPDAKGWWWYVGADDVFLAGVLDDNNARLVDFEAYEDGGTKYAAIMIENTGEDAMEWWWYTDVPTTTIWNNIAAHDSRLLEYQLRDPATGTFDAILIPNPEPDNINWWWYYNATSTQLNALLSQNGARITDLDTYLDGNTRRYSVVMVNNSNDLTTKMGELLGYGSDGSTGVYLMEVGGPILATLQPTFVYEPSSSIKVTHHLYAMRQVMIGADLLSNELTVAEGTIGISCPTGEPPFIVQTLAETLGGMMQFSINTDTAAIEDRYGRIAINAMSASVVGMANTSINHTLGCNEPPLNEMTLVDAALLYEGVAQGLLLDTATREDFYSLMQCETSPVQWWFTTGLENLIHEVATDLGIPGAATDYWDNTRLAWKPGGDTFTYDDVKIYRSVSGWVSLPWNCGEPGSQNKEYVFGLFVHSALNEAYADTRLGYAVELFREQVAAGLQSCVSAVGDFPRPALTHMLRSAYPNPFNPRTTIAFEIPERQAVTLRVFDMAGRLVRELIDTEEYTAGRHEVVWNGIDDAGRQVGSGTYFYQLEAGEYSETKRMALIK